MGFVDSTFSCKSQRTVAALISVSPSQLYYRSGPLLTCCDTTERSAATQEICIERAKKIFAPFKLEFGYVDWFSVYQIGQRIASAYTLDHRIILGGDATHTHSPSAGQG